MAVIGKTAVYVITASSNSVVATADHRLGPDGCPAGPSIAVHRAQILRASEDTQATAAGGRVPRRDRMAALSCLERHRCYLYRPWQQVGQ